MHAIARQHLPSFDADACSSSDVPVLIGTKDERALFVAAHPSWRQVRLGAGQGAMPARDGRGST